MKILSLGDIDVSAIQFADASHLMPLFLRLRKRIFIDVMNWPLFADDQLEFEQYDTFDSTYLVAHRGDEVLAGARLVNTLSPPVIHGVEKYSYMIRDAYLGKLDGLPSGLCFEEPPLSKDTWEFTRYVSIDKRAGLAVMMALDDFLSDQNAKYCLFLGPDTFLRYARKLRYDPVPIGPVVGNQDGSFLAFKIAVQYRKQARAKLSDA